MLKRISCVGVMIAMIMMGACLSAYGVGYPERTISVICPFGAGGGTDLATRALAENAKQYLNNVEIVIENKTGGAGAIGLVAAMTSNPDGYTLNSICMEMLTLSKLGLAPEGLTPAAFVPLANVNMEPAAITVRKDAPWKTLKEFVEDAKKRPGAISLANAGTGGIWHLAAIGLELRSGASFKHIPYEKGAVEALPAVLGGHVDAVGVSASEVSANVASGELKILGVASEKRLEAFPDVPTYAEQGYDLRVSAFRGIGVTVGPKDKPISTEIVKKLQDAFYKSAVSANCTTMVKNAKLTYTPMNAEETSLMIIEQEKLFDQIIAEYMKKK
jgi:tripartite-type tricarboxylate transporter receptor subunit TctC